MSDHDYLRQTEIEMMLEDAYSDLIFDPSDPVIRLFYYGDTGRFYDECGFPVDNEYEYVTQNELWMFFHKGVPMRFGRPNGIDVELMFPENIYD